MESCIPPVNRDIREGYWLHAVSPLQTSPTAPHDAIAFGYLILWIPFASACELVTQSNECPVAHMDRYVENAHGWGPIAQLLHIELTSAAGSSMPIKLQ